MLQRHRCSQRCVARCKTLRNGKTSPRRVQLRGMVGRGKRRRLWSWVLQQCGGPTSPLLPPSLANLLPPTPLSCPLGPTCEEAPPSSLGGGRAGSRGSSCCFLWVETCQTIGWETNQLSSIPFNLIQWCVLWLVRTRNAKTGLIRGKMCILPSKQGGNPRNSLSWFMQIKTHNAFIFALRKMLKIVWIYTQTWMLHTNPFEIYSDRQKISLLIQSVRDNCRVIGLSQTRR